jgi:glutamate racemase
MRGYLKKLAIFDSGLGGLTLYKAIKKLDPQIGIIYFADTKNVPYGNLSREKIFSYTKEAFTHLKDLGATSIAVACHTVSTTILPLIKKSEPIAIFDIASSSIPILNDYKKLSILSTLATYKSNYYQSRLIGKIQSFQPCPKLVTMIESGILDSEIVKESLLEVDRNVDALFLACTHFPLIKDLISINIPNIPIIDPAESFAKSLANESSNFNDEFFTTGDPTDFQAHASIFIKEQKVPSPFLVKSLYSPLI